MLTIQRQYSLPNCVLILEGLNADGSSAARPLLSTLTKFECHFGNEAQVIRGGRDLLALLAQRVHTQAQSLLSGIHGKQTSEMEGEELSLTPIEKNRFLLSISESLLETTSSSVSDAAQQTGDLKLQLNAVQLFDLVEALDQLMEDTQTLPDLSLTLRPLSRREAQSQGMFGQRVLPLGLGLTSLAVMAAISFVIPIPEITKPTAPGSGENAPESVDSLPPVTPSVPLSNPPSATPQASPEQSVSPANPSATPQASPE